MTYFEFTKRFPDETSAINFIVAWTAKRTKILSILGLTTILHIHLVMGNTPMV